MPFTVLPASLLVLAVWHRVVKRPLAALLPPRLAGLGARAGDRFRFGPPARLAWICLSVLAGASSHVVWDSFTHDGGFMVERVALLSRPLAGGVDVDEALQYLSGLLGMVFLAVWAHRQVDGAGPRRRVPGVSPAVRRAALGAILGVGTAGAAANAARLLLDGRVGAHGAVVAAVVGAMAAGSVAVTLVSAVVGFRLAPVGDGRAPDG